MLSVLATMPQDRGVLDASVIYIDTEAAFSATRLGVNSDQHQFSPRRISVLKHLQVIRIWQLSPNSDQHQISPHRFSVLKHIQVIRIWQMITKHELC